MASYFITGRQGSGKTTLIKMLQERGVAAYNTDDIPDSTRLQNNVTGEVVDWPEGAVDWSTYAWNWQAREIEHLLLSADTVFVGAIVNNQVDFYDKFDRVFVLMVSEENIRKRLMTHEHASHHFPGEIDRLVAAHKREQSKLLQLHAEAIDANGSVEDILEEILQRISAT